MMTRTPFSSFAMPRKAFEPGGFAYGLREGAGLPPLEMSPETAGFHGVAGERVPYTWDHVHNQRRKLQAERLRRLREPTQREFIPAQIWTFLVEWDFFSGWWCYIRTSAGEYISCGGGKGNVDRRSEMARSLMIEIPVDGLFPIEENWDDWMESFARNFPKKKSAKDPRRAGILTGWTDRRRFFVERPEKLEPLNLP